MRPGAASTISPGRATGRPLRSVPVTVIWLAMLGTVGGPALILGAPDGGVEGTGGVAGGVPAVAVGFGRGLARFVDTLMVGSVRPLGCPAGGAAGTATAGALTGASAGAGD